jgi:hypothetical protein
MADNNYNLSRRKALLGLGTIGAAGVGAGMGTSALFFDEESLTNNELVAGELNLRTSIDVVDFTSDAMASTIVAGSTPVPFDTVEDPSPFFDDSDNPNGTGLVTNQDGKDTAVVADGAAQAGLQLNDIKPGDSFVLCLQALLEGNPGYVRLVGSDAYDGYDPSASAGTDTGDSFTEPESDTDDEDNTEIGTEDGGIGSGPSGGDGITGTGELDNAIDVTVGDGYSSGSIDNVDSSLSGSLNQLMNDLTDGEGINFGGSAGVPGEVSPGTPEKICIKFEVPTSVGNEIQGDSVSIDLTFEAVQSRNNDAGTAFANTP